MELASGRFAGIRLVSFAVAAYLSTIVGHAASASEENPPTPLRDEFPDLREPNWMRARLTPSATLPAPDVLQLQLQMINRQFVPRESVWLEGDRRSHATMLAKRQVQTLVIPAQVQGFGTDRISRELWTADLTYSLAERGIQVADPYVVMRALGSGQRTIPLSTSDELAKQLGVTRLIETFIGHDRDHRLTVLVRVYRKTSADQSVLSIRPELFSWSALEFSDRHPAAMVARAILPELLLKLGVRPTLTAARPAMVTKRWVTLKYPERPDELLQNGARLFETPLKFALLGALAPNSSEEAGEQLFEKSLLGLSRSALPVEQTGFLRSYLLFKLKMRPAALIALKDSTSAPDVALRELLNGNLSGIGPLIDKVQGTERLLLEIEARDLSLRYSVADAVSTYREIGALAGRGPVWKTMLAQRWSDLDIHENLGNSNLKAALDSTFALKGYTLGDVIEQQRAVGSTNAVTGVDLSVLEHVRRVRALSGPEWCNARTALVLRPWDLLDLFEASGEANLVKTVQTELQFQGLPQQALRDLDFIEDRYSGRAAFSALRAAANAQLARAAPADGRGRFAQAAEESALLSIFWSQGQTESALAAMATASGGMGTAEHLASAYSYDVPGRDYWFIESTGFYGTMRARLARARDMLAYSQYSMNGLTTLLLSPDSDAQNEARNALEYRFKGQPDALSIRLRLSAPLGGPPSREAILAAIRAEPLNWSHYRELGLQMAWQGDYAGAAQVLAGFPGFNPGSGQDSVALSNYAYDVGSIFYWRAELEPAKRLNRIAAGFDNGSDASLTAAQRLLIMDRNFTGALAIAQDRSERYGDEFAFRDYVTLLYALGDRHRATATFDAVALNPDGAGAWQAALFGQRIMGLKDAELPKWIHEHVDHSADAHAFSYGAKFALMWNSMDRYPPEDLPGVVQRLAHDPIGVTDSGGIAYPILDGTGGSYLVHGSRFRHDKRPVIADGIPIDSELTLFARAYVALRHEKFADAVRLFDDLAGKISIDQYIHNGSAPYALPYFAYASSKAGDPLELEKFLDSIKDAPNGFEYYLAEAFFMASHGNRDRLLENLKKAYDSMPLTSDRPIFVDYQFAEACEWLYAEVPDLRIRAVLLDFAKRYEVVNPFRAWPYAVEAQYATDTRQRQTALGMAVYLDPQSVRLQNFSTAELAQARSWAKSATPFGNVPRSTNADPSEGLSSQNRLSRSN